jgi:hypothetical protein
MQRSALPAPTDRRSDRTDGLVASGPATDGATDTGAGPTAAVNTAGDAAVEADTVVVHVQLRPRRGATRKCLAALASLAAEHPAVSFAVTGLSKDDRVVRVTVGVDLGPRLGVAKFSAQAQAAYAFVSELFTALYDHMPVYTAEPSGAERAAAATLMEFVTGGSTVPGIDVGSDLALEFAAGVEQVSAPRSAEWGDRVSA